MNLTKLCLQQFTQGSMRNDHLAHHLLTYRYNNIISSNARQLIDVLAVRGDRLSYHERKLGYQS